MSIMSQIISSSSIQELLKFLKDHGFTNQHSDKLSALRLYAHNSLIYIFDYKIAKA